MQVVLTEKAKKLIRLCEIQGHKDLDGLLQAIGCDNVCPAICMTEGCSYTADMESDQREGYCEVCGGNTVVSALVLADLI